LSSVPLRTVIDLVGLLDIPLTDDASRHSANDGPGWDVAMDHRTGCDYRSLADRHPSEHNDARPQPRAVANLDGAESAREVGILRVVICRD
jgi:hypothetical protein